MSLKGDMDSIRCDEQLHNNKIKREKKTAKVNKLTASVESMTQDIAAMGKKIATLKSEQVEPDCCLSQDVGKWVFGRFP